ncbi:CapA family protein [Staphylococcus nepalensis]|uniref:CapA family protein n=1 Tax=Staphylococcus nepalensis TaxID=214473 RepID=UPI003EBD5C9D
MLKYKFLLTLLFLLFIVGSIFCVLNIKHLNHNISFYAVGDNLIHPEVYNDALKADGSFDFKPMYRPIKSDVESADIAFINQESPIGGDSKGLSGFKRFNTPEAIARDISNTGFDLVNGSNNHTLDQGSSGLINEINLWEKFEDIAYFGTYDSQNNRNTIQTIHKNNVDVALLSYTYGTNDIQPKQPYYINYFDEKQIKQDVAKAKKQSDVVIVSAHWGNEGKHQPNQMQQKYAKIFADAGVDVVIGTHPHVIQPVKWIKGKNNHKTLVAYSLGNFLNGQSTGDENNILGGNIAFNIKKTPKGIEINNVKWKSLVTHYEMQQSFYKDDRHNFKMYSLNQYNDTLARKHGLNQNDKGEVTTKRLKTITQDNINDAFLTEQSY